MERHRSPGAWFDQKRGEQQNEAAGQIRQASKLAPDLVLLDLGLPDADGSDVIRRIREWSNVPILVISARGAEQGKEPTIT